MINKNGALMGVPKIVNDRTFVPLRFISEFFGATVNWDERARSVEIIK
ncbi:MAG: copper amine oxidase N-terminal domain-containing protein [Defluviitaleaceae bacterium]|nr:copper amine oxidase N-terminal domain-containing protein [Defluviitaleaceae bacterium]